MKPVLYCANIAEDDIKNPDIPYVITDISERVSFIARPPVANLSIMLLTFSVTNPEPDLTLLDKMLLSQISE